MNYRLRSQWPKQEKIAHSATVRGHPYVGTCIL